VEINVSGLQILLKEASSRKGMEHQLFTFTGAYSHHAPRNTSDGLQKIAQ